MIWELTTKRQKRLSMELFLQLSYVVPSVHCRAGPPILGTTAIQPIHQLTHLPMDKYENFLKLNFLYFILSNLYNIHGGPPLPLLLHSLRLPLPYLADNQTTSPNAQFSIPSNHIDQKDDHKSLNSSSQLTFLCYRVWRHLAGPCTTLIQQPPGAHKYPRIPLLNPHHHGLRSL